jgi:hypothetical protein
MPCGRQCHGPIGFPKLCGGSRMLLRMQHRLRREGPHDDADRQRSRVRPSPAPPLTGWVGHGVEDTLSDLRQLFVRTNHDAGGDGPPGRFGCLSGLGDAVV